MVKAIACLSSIVAVLAGLAYVVSLPVFYGIFAFGDVENWKCYASQDHAITEPWQEPESPPEDYHDVSGKF